MKFCNLQVCGVCAMCVNTHVCSMHHFMGFNFASMDNKQSLFKDDMIFLLSLSSMNGGFLSLRSHCSEPSPCFCLHIQMNALKVFGDLLDSSGWTGALTQANIASSGTADSHLKVSHITRTQHAQLKKPVFPAR